MSLLFRMVNVKYKVDKSMKFESVTVIFAVLVVEGFNTGTGHTVEVWSRRVTYGACLSKAVRFSSGI